MKTHYSFKKSAWFWASIAVLAASSSCYWDESLYDEFVGDQGYLVTCRGRCLGEEIVSKEDCKGDDRQWIEQVKENSSSTGGDDHSDKTENPGEGSENPSDSGAAKTPLKSGYCLIQSKQACEELAKLDKYKKEEKNTEGKIETKLVEQLSWKDLDFQMLDLGNGEYGRFIPKGSYNPQSTPDEREKMEGVYVCGTFDEVKILKEEEASKHPCDAVRVEKIKRSFKGTSCPLVSNKCGYIESFKNKVKTEDGKEESALSFSQPSGGAQEIGFCSKCDPNQVMCGNECADLSTSTKHCGKCGNVCGESEYCSNGVCAAKIICNDGGMKCVVDGEETCVYPDQANTCGATSCNDLGSVCDTSETSCKRITDDENGNTKYACVALCEGKVTCIDSSDDQTKKLVCISPDDDSSCGATGCTSDSLGIQCQADQSCVKVSDGSYKCDCAEGEIKSADGKCYNPRMLYTCGTKSEDCSQKGDDEQKGRFTCLDIEGLNDYSCHCKKGYFEVISGNGVIECVDTKVNSKYCGTPDNYQTCNDTQKCVDGNCVCEDDKILCGNTCINSLDNSNYCGARGNCDNTLIASSDYKGENCGPTKTCYKGSCVCKSDEYVARDGKCIDPLSIETCGASETKDGTDCTAIGAVACSEGRCICPASTAQSRWVYLDKVGEIEVGKCIDIWNNPDYCGVTSSNEITKCQKNEFCLGGSCTDYGEFTCKDGKIRCERACLDSTESNVVAAKDKAGCECRTGYCGDSRSIETGCPLKLNTDKACGACPEYDNDGNVTNGADCTIQKDLTSCVETKSGYKCACPQLTSDSNINYCTLGENPQRICAEFKDYHIRWMTNDDAPNMNIIGTCSDHTRSDNIEYNVVCEDSYGNCDNDYSNGCEQLLNSIEHCGACGNKCNDLPNAKVACVNGSCVIDECSPDYMHCSNNPALGCETRVNDIPRNGFSDTAICGGCNKKKNKCNAYQSCQNYNCCYADGDISDDKIKAGECCNPESKRYKKCSFRFILCGNHDYQCALANPGDGWEEY